MTAGGADACAGLRPAVDAALALARCQADGQAFALVARPCVLPVAPLAAWSAAAGRTLLWHDGAWLLGEGAAWDCRADGPGRWAWLSRGQARLESRCALAVPAGAPALPLLLAACTFEEDGPGPGCWGAALPAARLWLPARLRLRQADGRGWEVLASAVQAAEDPAAICARLLAGPAPATAEPAPAWPPCADDFAEQVADAVDLINDGAFRKVVLARAVDGPGPAGGGAAALARLAGQAAGATVYAHDLGQGGLFLGATPELLLEAAGDQARTMALAASCRAGEGDGEQLGLVAELLASTKNRKEHGIVVEHLAAVLRPRCRPFTVPATPHPRRVGGLLHLETLFAAELVRRDYLELAGALAPTPAVCGLPVATARHWLRRHERLQRGLYAGVLGWVGPDSCRLVVPLRGGVVAPDGGRTRLFAGAGVVETSDPAAELAETELKLGVMREVLEERGK
ncbi:MAG: isochorismate synthase [Planctomycetes bacterium]|nr:isochorismate synthase [Planctomycetota bacterium]